MRFSHLLVLLLIMLTRLTVPELAFAFTATDYSSRIDIDAIDIAPTSTPVPKRSLRLPTKAPSQPEAVMTPLPVKKQEEKPVAKKFFIFTVGSSEVAYGQIDPTNPVIRTHKLVLTPAYAPINTIFLYQNHPLQVQGKQQVIPDTSCDDGVCTESRASLWENALTYGSGYRCDSDAADNPCAPDFRSENTYRQFTDLSKKENAVSLLRSTRAFKPIEARITYKVNITGTQESGTYTNSLVLIAAPAY